MSNYYDINAINFIFYRFKVKNVIFIGFFKGIDQIQEYCNDNNIAYKFIDLNEDNANNISEHIPLNKLKNIQNYDAIFLNDDANWYTIYNELNIIKNNNEEFPLVFICNNVFPNQKRDSYRNPKIIPKEFLNEFSDEFIYNNISLYDGLFHAIDENTPKNGVLTAIADFLSENDSIALSNIKFIDGITILYHKNNISYIRWTKLEEDLKDQYVELQEFSDNIIQNNYLTEYISKFNAFNDSYSNIAEFENEITKKDNMISEYENIIKIHNAELDYKNSQIKGMDSKLNLKDSKIRNMESKLNNYETEINDLNNQVVKFNEASLQDKKSNAELNNQLRDANSQINSLRSELDLKGHDFKNKELEFNNQLRDANSQINSLRSELDLKGQDFQKEFNSKNSQLSKKDEELNKIKYQYSNQLSKLDAKEYCISCFKEEIDNNHLEIDYLKNTSLTKKILNPLSYLYLIVKSNPRELSLNFKLYKALKNSKCFDIGYYLNKNKDIQESKWCKYFSPELHYVCVGFYEKRKFNKKYFNRNSKKELLDYIIKCS